MQRTTHTLFSPGHIGRGRTDPLTLPNRLVRSATWDPSILGPRAA